jgi:hypothetical protein
LKILTDGNFSLDFFGCYFNFRHDYLVSMSELDDENFTKQSKYFYETIENFKVTPVFVIFTNLKEKWLKHFYNIDAVIYVAALSQYNQLLHEDSEMNRIDDTLKLLQSLDQ